MRDIVSRLIRAVKIRWWAWRNPPPTLEQINMARVDRLYSLDSQHKIDLAAFDAQLSPVLQAARWKNTYPARVSMAGVPGQLQAAVNHAHTPDEPYLDYVCDGYRVYKNGDRVPIPRR